PRPVDLSPSAAVTGNWHTVLPTTGMPAEPYLKNQAYRRYTVHIPCRPWLTLPATWRRLSPPIHSLSNGNLLFYISYWYPLRRHRPTRCALSHARAPQASHFPDTRKSYQDRP